jgi:hypothetical protein
MVATQLLSPRKTSKTPRISANRVRSLLLELTYRLHTTKVLGKLPRSPDHRRALPLRSR